MIWNDRSKDSKPLGKSTAYYQVPASTSITITVDTAYDDHIQGDSGTDIICAWDGGDFVKGGRGDDSLYGGDESDSLPGQRGSDFLDGGDGPDSIFGSDLLSPNAADGDDTIRGDAGDGEKDGATCTDVEQGPIWISRPAPADLKDERPRADRPGPFG